MPSQLKQQLATKLHNYGSSNTINLDPITYNSRYPGFDQANYRKLESKADNLGLTGYQREQFMDNLYQQVLPEVQKQIKNSDRRKYINDANYEISQIQDKDAQIQAKSKLAVTEISQKLKEKYNIDPSTNDEQIFNDWIKSVPNGNQLFTNYLNKGDTELLEKGGLGGNEVDNDSYAKIESKINGALKGDWGRLSTNGLKYVQGWKLILDATELAKAKGATGMNDGEIMRNVIKSSPKLQQKIAELQTIQKGLTDSDKSVLKGETNGVTVGKSGFSILPGISLQLGDDAGMNISLVNDKPASYKDIQDLIDVKEKFGDNYVGEVGNVAKVFASQPIDTLKKKGNQILNEFDNIGTNMENFWNDIMPKGVVEVMQGKEMSDEEFEQFKQNKSSEYDARKDKNKEKVLKYNDKINKAFQKQVEQNLDPQIKEYYDDKTITELLALGDMQGVGYKQAQMMASNWDMLPNIVVTAVNTPAGLTMMFGDSYARESQDSFERLMDAGADYDQASGISKVVGVINGAVEVGLDRLFGGVETTASKNLKNAFMNNLTEEATKKGFWEILGNIANKQVGSSLEEGAEEVIQEIVSNAAEMTIKDNPEFADLFKGTWEAFEGGVFNPMNLMAGGSDIAANKGNIQQSLLDASYDAGVTARNIVDAGENMKNNLREFMLDGAYNAGKGARNIVEWADKVKEFMSRKKNQNQTTNNVEVETTEKVEKPGIIDRVTDRGAEKITNTVSAQDKLYKAQEPRMNVLSKKKDLEKRRANSDRSNQLIVQNGYTPTNTAERLEAHEATMKKIWGQVEDKINGGQEIMVDLTQIADILDDYIQSQRDTKSTLMEGDLAKLEKESKALRGQKVRLPVAERLKQRYNSVINNRGEEKASDTIANGLQKATHEIGVIEDNLLSEIPGEFQGLKNDFGALKDTYEDVFKADMKNQKKKGLGLTETYSRIEGIGDIANGLLGVVTGKGDLASIGKGATKFLVGKSLAKASDVDFLIEQGFKELAKQYGNNGNVTTNTTPTTPTATAPTTRTTTEITEDIDLPKKEKTIIRDSNGDEVVAYHGSNYKGFDKQYISRGGGFRFTTEEGEAGSYGKYVKPYKLKASNILDMDAPNFKELSDKIIKQYTKEKFGREFYISPEAFIQDEGLRDYMQELGYDALKFTKGDLTRYIVYDENQILPYKETKKKTSKKGLDKNQASSKTATDMQKTKLNTNTDTSDMVKVSKNNTEGNEIANATKGKSNFVDFNDIDLNNKKEYVWKYANDYMKEKMQYHDITHYTNDKLSMLDKALKSKKYSKGVGPEDFKASYTLGEILDNPELYKKYPSLKDKEVMFVDFHTNRARGLDMGGTIFINSKYYAKDPGLGNSTIVHEIEHEIQKLNGEYVDDEFDTYTYKANPNEIGARNKQKQYLEFIGRGDEKMWRE